jgi:hypothetical protein
MDSTRPIQWFREWLRLVVNSWVFHLFFASFVILLVFARPPQVFSGDTDTARNYLNTIVSSLSTILALCISIILVAIQMAANNYTHRVLDFFVRLPYNVSLFLFYLVTIMHSFFLMAKIHDPIRDPLPMSLRPEMSADLILVVISFLSLLIYMYAVVQLLKPERIIELILREYNKAFHRGNYAAALDNVEQICDIAKRAATFSDSLTGMRCMDAMLNIGARLPLPLGKHDPLLQIHQNLVDQWGEIVGVAVKEHESGLLKVVLAALQVQGQLYMEEQSWPTAELVIRAYRHLTFSHFISEGQLMYVQSTAHHLYQLARSAVSQEERGQMFALRTWQVNKSIGESVFAADSFLTASLAPGFLMFDEFSSIVDGLASQQRIEAVAVYFEMWKAFAKTSSIETAAQWAQWWKETTMEGELFETGVGLAQILARHVDRLDISKTLSYVWGLDPTTVDAERLQKTFANHLFHLLDGWPLLTVTGELPSSRSD